MTDLSGEWDGIFSYPDGGSTTFRARLFDAGGALTGEVEEDSDHPDDASAALQSWLEGANVDGAVQFRKSYDDPARFHYVVEYDGHVAEDGGEIAGTWTIRGEWSGPFLMTRRATAPVAAVREAGETVR